jgi:hypothetical protein
MVKVARWPVLRLTPTGALVTATLAAYTGFYLTKKEDENDFIDETPSPRCC